MHALYMQATIISSVQRACKHLYDACTTDYLDGSLDGHHIGDAIVLPALQVVHVTTWRVL